MRKFVLWIIALLPIVAILLLAFIGFVRADQAANCPSGCYWYGGNGNFSQINNWSTSSNSLIPCFCYPNGPVSVILDAKGNHLVLTQDIPVLVTGTVKLLNDTTVKIANNTKWIILGYVAIENTGISLSQIWDYMRLLIFTSLIVFGLIFAFKIKGRRSGGSHHE